MKKYRHPNAASLLVLAAILLFGCNYNYVAYQTQARNEDKTWAQLAEYQRDRKQIVICSNEKQYFLKKLELRSAQREIAGRLIQDPFPAMQAYQPDPVVKPGRRVYRGNYENEKGEGIILSQVYILADTVDFSGESIVVPISAVRRIDEIKENNDNNTGAIIVLASLAALLIFYGIYLLIKNSTEQAITSTAESCFIATACYGDYDAPEVLVLRRYRDETLLRTRVGRLFVRCYYRVSPPLARMIRRSELLKRSIRGGLLRPLVSAVQRRQHLRVTTSRRHGCSPRQEGSPVRMDSSSPWVATFKQQKT